jgi:HSP20 family molecular chaperone IbpA
MERNFDPFNFICKLLDNATTPPDPLTILSNLNIEQLKKKVRELIEGLETPSTIDYPTITLKNHKTTDTEFYTEIEVPGISPSDLEVKVDPSDRTITIYRFIREETKKTKNILLEFDVNPLYDLKQISPVYKNGVLQITILADPSLLSRRVSIEVLPVVEKNDPSYPDYSS